MSEKVISFKNPLFDVKTLKSVTHSVSNIHVDSFSEMVRVVIEKGLKVDTVNMTMEHAQNIGFINLDALKSYCK